MINLIRIKNFNPKLINYKKLNFKSIGFINYISMFEHGVDLVEVLKKFEFSMDEFKIYLKDMEKKEILSLDFVIEENGMNYWDIELIYRPKISNTSSNIINEVFILTKEQSLIIESIEDSKEQFLRLYKIFENSRGMYDGDKLKAIETEEEYIEYLKTVNPLTLLSELNINVDVKALFVIYDSIVGKKVKKEVVNFLIDYVVNTSVYKNFSINFFTKVLDNWITNNILTLEEAMKYIKESKNIVSEKNNKYKDPTWEELPQETNNKVNKSIKLEEIEKLMQGKE